MVAHCCVPSLIKIKKGIETVPIQCVARLKACMHQIVWAQQHWLKLTKCVQNINGRQQNTQYAKIKTHTFVHVWQKIDEDVGLV